tara:strand:- start:147 stop:812 length:666 start_codon:yes stop_codon:yes gene_type:complete
MENTTTLISELPNDIKESKKIDSESNVNYQPINPHPNPYGISEQNPLSNPEQTHANENKMIQSHHPNEQIQMALSHQQLNELKHQQSHTLPSRDIPQDTTRYSNDEEIQPNYIPKPRKKVDFVSEEDIITERNLREYEDNKRKENKLDILLSDIQIPILVSILYFIFQLPVINTLVLKNFSFLSIYNLDGNFNLTGLLLKSGLFGSMYYSFNTILTLLSNI